MNLPNNAAADYYYDLVLLTDKAGRQRGGPSLFQEVEALAIIGDLNGELAGNVFTTYGAWNAWRAAFDLN